MLGNVLVLLGVVAVVILFAWLTRRAWRLRHALVRYPAVVVAGLLTLLTLLIAVLGGYGLWVFYKPYPVLAAPVKIDGTPEQVARGQHIASMLCASCHSQNGELPLSGGNDLSADTGIPLGSFTPPNLTPGGRLAERSDEDLFRILRTGVRRDGRITAMAGLEVIKMGDEDAKAAIAFLRSQPSVARTTPEVQPSFLLALMIGAGLIPFPEYSTLPSIPTPPKSNAPAYGEYLISFMDCRGCHNKDLGGDAPPPNPPAPNLTVIVPKWSKDDFFKTMRTGVDPTGHQLNPPMPWKTIGKLDDVELEAVYRYLNGLTPIIRQK